MCQTIYPKTHGRIALATIITITGTSTKLSTIIAVFIAGKGPVMLS